MPERRPRRHPSVRAARWLASSIAVLVLAVAAGPAAAQQAATQCPPGRIARGDTCLDRATVQKRVDSIVRRVMRTEGLKSVIYSVRVGGRPVVTAARGESMTGVPATTAMNFRIGAVSISYLGTLALQLHEEGVLDIDAPIDRWYPGLPNGDRVTPRMLLIGTAGYRDFVGFPRFNTAFYADPFRQWTARQLVGLALARPPACAPGTCWTYSHANFVILGEVLSRASGTPLPVLMQRRILGPAGLRNTVQSSTASIPEPVLHAFTKERGTYEESTYWNPSWTLAPGAVQTSTIRDVVRSAEVIGSGRLLTPASYREFTAPTVAGLGPWTEDFYYGMGMLSDNGWLEQTPSFAGFFGVMGYNPERRIAIAVASTKLESAEVDPNFSVEIFRRVAAYLAPGAGPRN